MMNSEDCWREFLHKKTSRVSAASVGSPSSPIGLLLLGSLRCIGCGLTFDAFEECAAMNEETHHQFFHVFVEH